MAISVEKWDYEPTKSTVCNVPTTNKVSASVEAVYISQTDMERADLYAATNDPLLYRTVCDVPC